MTSVVTGPEYPSYFAKNCYSCLPPKECPFPRPQGAKSRTCPYWNDNPFRTTSSGLGIEKMKMKWLEAGYSKKYIPSVEAGTTEDDEEVEEITA